MPSGAFPKGHIRPNGSGWLAVVTALEEQTIIFAYWDQGPRMIRMCKDEGTHILFCLKASSAALQKTVDRLRTGTSKFGARRIASAPVSPYASWSYNIMKLEHSTNGLSLDRSKMNRL